MSELTAGAFLPLFFSGGNHLRGLKLYEINSNYIKYLAKYQDHLFISDGDKANRKYIGIILQMNGLKYFAPLSSFKQKHKRMKGSVDFIKLRDYAVININNIVPVPEGEYHLVDVNGTKDQQYRFLMQAESREINRQRNRILKNADIVYKHKLRYGDATPLAKRTNNFVELEKRCKEYIG
ncbi:MAG: type III toxin-antitoxin system ToxN/AbiQ family toxin [Clostridiales bacterium]|nr:type III toxin-antitoxin system ToxN/AbiQ family toxin [Clostridiales bacterium]